MLPGKLEHLCIGGVVGVFDGNYGFSELRILLAQVSCEPLFGDIVISRKA
jgi:hypothetical protein